MWIAFVRVVAIASTDQIGKVLGRYFGAAAQDIGIKQVPYSAWGCNPQAFAPGGGKDGFGDRFILYPHTQITEVLLPLVMARGVVLRKRSAVVDYWVVLQKN